MPTYDINVYRDGQWWMIEIADLNGLTQARHPGEIDEMARSYIAVDTGTPIEDVEIIVR